MPTYDYNCEKCDEKYETISSIREYTGQDPCPSCGNVGTRIISAPIGFIGEKVESAEFNPAFGQVVKSKRHRDELARVHNMEEVGNETPTVMKRDLEDETKKRADKAWEDL